MNIYSIYKATNRVNNKSYIGFDSKWPRRKTGHKDSYLKEDTVFYRALRKYGWDNFDWEIIYQSKDLVHTKNEMENHFIYEHNTFIHFGNSQGYNMTLGGDGTLGSKQTIETKEKTKKTMLEKYGVEHQSQSPEIHERKKQTSLKNWGYEHPLQVPELIAKRKLTCLKKYGVDNAAKQEINCKFCGKHCIVGHEKYCSDNPNRYLPYDRNGKNNPMYGKTQSEEAKEKQREKRCKRKYSITSPSGETFITNNIKKFCREHNLDSSNVYNIVNGKYKQYKGYTGKILEE